MSLRVAIIHPVLLDPTPEQQIMVLRLFFPMRQLMTNVKVLDFEGKEVVKPPFLYSDAIADDDFNMFAEE